MTRLRGMPFRKMRLLFLLVLCHGLLLLGCGGGQAREDAEGRTTVNWMMATDLSRPLIEELVEEFESRNPDIHINVIWIPAVQYQTKFKTLVAAGQAPDLFYCGDVWIAYLRPFTADITDLVERDAEEIGLDDFYPELLEACRHEGRYYFLPRWFNVSLLYYNTRIFDEAGIDYPSADWTWADYRDTAIALTKRDERGRVVQWGSDVELYWWGQWLPLLRQSGGEFFDEETGRSGLDSPEAIRALKFYRDTIFEYKFSPSPGFRPQNGFAANNMAMAYGGHLGWWLTYRQIEQLEWDIAPLPEGPATRDGGELAVDAMGISRDSPVREEAWEFMKFIVSRHSIHEHYKLGYPPVRRSVAEETLLAGEPGSRPEAPQNAEVLYDSLKNARPIPRHPNYIEIALDIVQPEIDLMLDRGLSAEETARNASRAANAFLEVLAPSVEVQP